MQNSASGGQLSAEPKEEAPWYVKYGVRIIATCGGGLALLLGAIGVIGSILTISPLCIILNVWQMLLGFGVIIIESPCCCVFVEHIHKITEKVDSKPVIFKAALYVFGPLPTVLICFGLNVLFGNILIVGAGIIYGFMALGKKADRSEMARNAQQQTAGIPSRPVTTDKVTIIGERSAPPPRPPNPSGLTGPPPPYTDLQSTNNVGWDTSYLQSSTTSLNDPYKSSPNPAASVNPVPNPSTPFNPFQ